MGREGKMLYGVVLSNTVGLLLKAPGVAVVSVLAERLVVESLKHVPYGNLTLVNPCSKYQCLGTLNDRQRQLQTLTEQVIGRDHLPSQVVNRLSAVQTA